MTVKISKSEFKNLYSKSTINELAEHYNVSRVTIINWAKKLGLSKRKPVKFEFID